MTTEDLTHLEVTAEERCGALIVRLRGRAGVRELPLLQETIRDQLPPNPRLVIMDLTRLDYLAEPVLGLLASWRQYLIRQGSRIVLAGASPSLRQLLAESEYGCLFPKVLDVETALARTGRDTLRRW